MGSLGPLGSALILDHDRVALAHQPGEERAAHFAFLEVRGPDQNRRQLVAGAGADHSGGKPDPVPHRHHDHPLHRGEVGNAHPLKQIRTLGGGGLGGEHEAAQGRNGTHGSQSPQAQSR